MGWFSDLTGGIFDPVSDALADFDDSVRESLPGGWLLPISAAALYFGVPAGTFGSEAAASEALASAGVSAADVAAGATATAETAAAATAAGEAAGWGGGLADAIWSADAIPGFGTALQTIGSGLGNLAGNTGLLKTIAGSGASLLSAKQQADALRQASASTSAASAYATDLQRRMYEQTRADQLPWRTAGTNALSMLSSGMGADGTSGDLTRSFGMSDFTKDPGYDFRLKQGQQAMERGAAARGGLQSGAALKAGQEYGQNFATGEYQNAYNRFGQEQANRFNRLASVAGLGQTANAALQGAGDRYSSGVTDVTMSNAANQGNALLAAANARGSAYQSIGNQIGDWLQPQQQRPIYQFGG